MNETIGDATSVSLLNWIWREGPGDGTTGLKGHEGPKKSGLPDSGAERDSPVLPQEVEPTIHCLTTTGVASVLNGIINKNVDGTRDLEMA